MHIYIYVTGSSIGCAPGSDAVRVFKQLRRKCCLRVCNFICNWLDFLVFSDKDDKPEVPSHNSLNVDNSVGRKRTYALRTIRKEEADPGAAAVFRMPTGGGVGEVGHLRIGP